MLLFVCVCGQSKPWFVVVLLSSCVVSLSDMPPLAAAAGCRSALARRGAGLLTRRLRTCTCACAAVAVAVG